MIRGPDFRRVTAFAMAVSTGPGATALTRIPREASSMACCWVRCASPALLVPYAVRSVEARNPEMEVMLTIAPRRYLGSMEPRPEYIRTVR